LPWNPPKSITRFSGRAARDATAVGDQYQQMPISVQCNNRWRQLPRFSLWSKDLQGFLPNQPVPAGRTSLF